MRRLPLLVLIGLGLFGIVLATVPGRLVAQPRAPIVQVSLDMGVTPPAINLLRRAMREATAAEASALIVVLPHGGGVLSSAWTIGRELSAANVPVVVWIGPGAVDGGPTGALLLAASDVAAMAPGASMGFALPLAETPRGFSTATRQLVLDDVARELTGWQEQRGRNTEWFDRAVRSGAVIDAARARSLEPPVIDLVAATNDELQTTITGRDVTVAGNQQQLDTLGAPRVVIRATAIEWLAQALAIPTFAFVLFVLGAVAIYLEIASPGVGVPGVAGGILIALALYGFAQASVRPLAVLLLAVGLVVVGLEHLVMSHGGLTFAGIVLLIVGALWLVDPAQAPGLAVAPLALGGTVISLLLAVVGLILLAVRIRGRGPSTGQEELIGQIAEVRRTVDPEGLVFVSGALWSAWTDDGPLLQGELVEVVAIESLRLYVRRLRVNPGSVNAEG
jgi:membrane-bound serine protease (ClpP class)